MLMSCHVDSGHGRRKMPEDNVTKRLRRILDELREGRAGSIDDEVLSRLDAQLRELRGSTTRPSHVDAVEDRDAREAEERETPEETIELGRIFVGADETDEPTLRFDEESGSYVLEAPYGLERSDPPSIEREPLDPRRVEELEGRPEGEGRRPPHLPVTYRPENTEQVRRFIREGNDIPVVIFPPDTRYIFHDASFPWCTTGRVETGDGSCTGTMIGRRLMVTAGHCIDWTEEGADWVKFTPAYYAGDEPFGHAWGTRVIYWDRPDGSDGLSDQETAFDYAVVVLDRNMGDLTGFAGYRTYSSSWNDGKYWQQIGYPGDLTGGQRPAFFSPGVVTSAQSKSTSGQTGYVLGHFNDNAPGHSGGPHWGWWGDEPWPRVVGVESVEAANPGTDTSGDNEAGGGPALASLVAYARSNYA